MIEQLSQEELNAMKTYIASYAFEESGSDRSQIADMDYILRIWETEKSKYLYRLLGNNLKITKDVNYHMSIDEIIDILDNTVYRYVEDGSLFIRWFNGLTGYHGAYSGLYQLCRLTDPDCLATNIYDGKDFSINLPYMTKPYVIRHGCKVSKVLKKIADAFDMEEEYEKFRISHSKALNQSELRGKLTISIHPFDFMTMSDNDCDWTSCMSWIDYGEYRRGTVEMMNSPCVVVAYLESKNPFYPIKEFKWNNKKWRSLFIVTEDIITEVKNYPYQNDELNKIVKDTLKSLAEENLGFSYLENLIAIDHGSSTVVNINNTPITLKFTFYTDAMYNDFDSLHHHQVYINSRIKENKSYAIHYSGKSECMICGQINDNFSGEGRLVCNDCESLYYCSYCGERISSDDIHWVDGEAYCENCYGEKFCTCPVCWDEECYSEDTNSISITINNKIYPLFSEPICQDCFEDMISGEDLHDCIKAPIKKIREDNGWYHYDVHYIDINDLTSKGIRYLFPGFKTPEEIENYVIQILGREGREIKNDE